MAPQHTSDMIRVSSRQIPSKNRNGIDQIWLEVLEKIQIDSLKEFLYQEGKLISVSFGAASTVGLMFSSHLTKSKAEKFSGHILEAFESVLGSQVTIEIRCESKKDPRGVISNGSFQMVVDPDVSQSVPRDRDANAVGTQAQLLQLEPLGVGRSEIVEIGSSPGQPKSTQNVDNSVESDRRSLGTAWVGEVTASHKNSTMVSIPERRKLGERSQSQSLVRGKVSLAHVIQQVEGCAQQSGWSKRKAVSIAEKLEQENLRLEPKSRNVLCWKASRSTRGKLSRVKIRTRKPHSLLKLVSCGKCLLSKSPR